jgi:D-alanyl-D-alanine carboxypeptidase/D-alanyl-D-alanine-endopeptidase (penicillin-binding protein 4)
MFHRALLPALILHSIASVANAAPWKSSLVEQLKNGGAYVEDESGPLFSHRADERFIPASVTKVVTAYCALEELSPEFRMETDFFSDDSGTLYVKGSGDPNLISEELEPLGRRIADVMPDIQRIVVDSSRFDTDLRIDGSSATLNPYDAPNGALLVNFNTIAVEKLGSGSVVSGEPQTPLTPLARSLAQKLAPGVHRVNIGSDVRVGARYAGELLAAFISRGGGNVRQDIVLGTTPPNARLLLRHRSSKALDEVVRGLLKFSTNFTANQVFLILGAQKYGFPATIEKGTQALRECLEQRLSWKNFSFLEGAGLSRNNLVSPRQLVGLLRAFEKYQDLMPQNSAFRAKTGTLTGVNTYAGYFTKADGNSVRFALLVNSAVPHNYKFQLAKSLYQGVTGTPPPPFDAK